MKFTGERYTPGLDWPVIGLEHWHRYLFATPWVTGKQVLDIACGEGYGSYLLAQKAVRVVGVDVHIETLQHASSTYLKNNLEFLRGECARIPVDGQGIFDVVVSFETIEHLDTAAQQAFLLEVKRLLKPDGLFLVSTPNKLFYTSAPGTENPFHRQEYYIGEFRALLQNHFRQVRLLGQKVYPVSYIWDVNEQAKTCAEYGLEFTGKKFRPAPPDKKVLYALAVCTDGALTPGDNSILVDLSETILQRIQELEHCIQASEQQHKVDLATGRREKEHSVAELKKTVYGKDGQIRELEGVLYGKDDQIRTQCAVLQAQVPDLQRLRAIENSLTWRTFRRALDVWDGLFPLQTRRGQLYRKLIGKLSAVSAPCPVPEHAPSMTPAELPQDETAEIAALNVLRFVREENPRVSVLVPAFNHWRLTYICLQSILKNTQEIPYEVVLVDDASSDATPQVLSKVLGITSVRNNVNQGFLHSCNHGLQHCRGEYVLFLNNDTQVTPNWLAALVETLERDPSIGAAGAKLIYPDGRLQEAGSIIWSDGSAKGYGRGANPSEPSFNYLRDVDYCSAACLLVRKSLLTQLGGFDPRYAPGYYEDTDVCLGIRSLGFRVVYQPAAAVVHHESISSSSIQDAVDRMSINQPLFVQKWGAFLKQQSLRGDWNVLRARDTRQGKRVLFIDDMVPVAHLGSGFPRSQRMLRLLAELGYVCTFFPLADAAAREPDTRELQNMGVEVFAGDYARIDAFLEERRGLYDLVLISRPHNAARVMQRVKEAFPNAWLIYDAECIFSAREILREQITGTPLDAAAQARLINEELSLMRQADSIIAVSDAEKIRIEQLGCGPVYVWGNPVSGQPPEQNFGQRADLLFVGGFLQAGSPNEDAITYFVKEVFPLVRRELGCRLVVAGTNRLSAIRDLACADICVTGHVEALRPYYEQARIFIVPTRFAAGVPQKLHDAMSHGLPAVVTPLIAEQLELADGDGLLVGSNPEEFAAKIITLYRDPSLWHKLQQRALEHVSRYGSPDQMKKTLAELVRATMVDETTLPEPVRRQYPVRRMPSPRSLMVRLDLTNKCNLACLPCTLRYNRQTSSEDAGEMDLSLFAKIAEQVFPYANAVALSCEAEPILHSRFLDVLRIVGQHRGPVYKITTNGALLDEEKTEALLTSGVQEIYLSIDGATATTYERIRRNGSFQQLTEAIGRINRWKDTHAADRHDPPLLQINYTLMHSTLDELPRMVELCREWRVDRLVVQHIYCVDVTGLQKESLIDTPEESDAVLSACQTQCDKFGIRTLFPSPFEPGAVKPPASKPTAPGALDCYAPWRIVRIRWNGDVYPCDLWRGPGLGNLKSQSFADIWNSTRYIRLRWDHARCHPTHPNCRDCDMVTTENIEGREVKSPLSFTPASK